MPNVVSGNSGYLVVSPVSSSPEESLGDRNHPIQDHPSTTALYSTHVGGQSMSKCILSKTQERQNERINIIGQNEWRPSFAGGVHRPDAFTVQRSDSLSYPGNTAWMRPSLLLVLFENKFCPQQKTEWLLNHMSPTNPDSTQSHCVMSPVPRVSNESLNGWLWNSKVSNTSQF